MTTIDVSFQVSVKKKTSKSSLKRSSDVPLTSSPYQLSVSFSHKFLSRYQYDIYEQSWTMAKQLLKGSKRRGGGGTEVVIGKEGGYAAAVVALMAGEKISFRTQVPEQLVVLDPNLSQVDTQYVRLLQRYKELLRNSGGSVDDVSVKHVAGVAFVSTKRLFHCRRALAVSWSRPPRLGIVPPGQRISP